MNVSTLIFFDLISYVPTENIKKNNMMGFDTIERYWPHCKYEMKLHLYIDLCSKYPTKETLFLQKLIDRN